MHLNMSRRGCCEQTFIDLRLHAWCGWSSLLPRTGAEVEEIIVSYEVQVQNEWTSSSFSPGGNHHFLTERFDTNFAISQEQSVPVATQRSAFLCQYSYWAERSMALRVFDPTVLFWFNEIRSFKYLHALSMVWVPALTFIVFLVPGILCLTTRT